MNKTKINTLNVMGQTYMLKSDVVKYLLLYAAACDPKATYDPQKLLTSMAQDIDQDIK